MPLLAAALDDSALAMAEKVVHVVGLRRETRKSRLHEHKLILSGKLTCAGHGPCMLEVMCPLRCPSEVVSRARGSLPGPGPVVRLHDTS
jgi:hypothetical protein